MYAAHLETEADLANALLATRHGGQQMPAERVMSGLTIERAYAIQAAYVTSSSSAPVGWKLGATAESAQQTLGLDAPFFGPVLEGSVFQTGAHVSIPRVETMFAEAEICLRLNDDYNLAGASEPPRLSAALAIELVTPRFDGELTGKGLAAIADGGICHAVVVGPFIPHAHALPGENIALSVDGSVVADGYFSNLVWDSLPGCLEWLVAHQNFAGNRLRKGDILMTGSCTGMIRVAPGNHLRASAAAFGAVDCTLA